MKKSCLYRNRFKFKVFLRIIFGIIWLVDGSFKFLFMTPSGFLQDIQAASAGQPAFLMQWFNLWSNLSAIHPIILFYVVGTAEVLLGLGLIFGVLRKLIYLIGAGFSFMIYAIPEGFGGPYVAGATDVGTSIIYILVFLCLMLINATYGTSKYSIDNWIEKHVKWWHHLAEFQHK